MCAVCCCVVLGQVSPLDLHGGALLATSAWNVAGGSLTRGEGFAAGEVLATALPFLVGWFAAAPVAGTFGDDARVGIRGLAFRVSGAHKPTNHCVRFFLIRGGGALCNDSSYFRRQEKSNMSKSEVLVPLFPHTIPRRCVF
jgi:hypothetical protein